MNSRIMLVLILISICPALVSASPEGTFLRNEQLITSETSSTDIVPLLNASSADTPVSVEITRLHPSEGYTYPSASAAEIIYLVEGTASIGGENLSHGDAVLIPAGEVLINNTGNADLVCIRAVSQPVLNETGISTPVMRQSVNARKLFFGNGSERFTVTRLMSPYEEPLPINFDLAIVNLSAGNRVADHRLDYGEIVYDLSGEGYISIGCQSALLQPGDIAFIPPNTIQSLSAASDQSLLLITNPFYTPESDHMAPGQCPTGDNLQ